MTKDDLVTKLSEDSGASKKQVETMLKSFTSAVREQVLQKGESITIVGLGTFKQATSAATTARNPKTGGSVSVPAKTKVKFKASSQLVLS